MDLEVTDIRVRLSVKKGPGVPLAFVRLKLNNEFQLKDIRVVSGPSRLLVAMPSERDKRGQWYEVFHPLNKGFRDYFETEVLRAYESALLAQKSSRSKRPML